MLYLDCMRETSFRFEMVAFCVLEINNSFVVLTSSISCSLCNLLSFLVLPHPTKKKYLWEANLYSFMTNWLGRWHSVQRLEKDTNFLIKGSYRRSLEWYTTCLSSQIFFTSLSPSFFICSFFFIFVTIC